MNPLPRRGFLTAAALSLTAASSAALQARSIPAASAQTTPSSIGPSRLSSDGPAPEVPTRTERHRTLVIGSGFGGGVTALRLAQAGVPTTVLERGRRWPTGPNSDTFPTLSTMDKRLLWHRSSPQLFGRHIIVEPYLGVLEADAGPTMTVLVPACLGGGSILYQGMSLEPDREVFNATFPEELDWERMHQVHYPRVAEMLQLATCPDDIIASAPYTAARVFADRVRAAGMEVEKIPMPLNWDFARRELAGEYKAAYTNGDMVLGVNNGGKHTVDVTYLAQAEATGLATIRTHTEVTDIERAPDGSWQVHAHLTDDTGTVLERQVHTTDAVFLAAGSMNSTRLLMRARHTGSIPDLPDAVGEGWGTNGDRIYLWSDPTAGFGAVQGGPVVYGTKQWGDPGHAHTVIQASIPPLGVDAATTMMVGYGVSSSRGRFRWDATADSAVLDWPVDGDAELVTDHIRPTADRIVGRTGFLTDTNAVANSTWHPLGGACMGTVCDLEGRVLDQRGLYVVDGALIPGTTAGCNPSMTIAAVAERALDHIVGADVGAVF